MTNIAQNGQIVVDPHNKELHELRREFEKAIVGQILSEEAAFFIAHDYLSAGSFENLLCKEVWKICEDLSFAHQPIDLLSVTGKLTSFREVWISDGHKHRIEKRDYSRIVKQYELTQMMECVSSSRHIAFHALTLVELGIRQYLDREIRRILPSLSSAIQSDLLEFRDQLNLINGGNDLFNLLDQGLVYFRHDVSEKIRKVISNCLRIVDLKANRIKQKAGLEMIENTWRYYNQKSISNGVQPVL